jgi:hypothetical protein
MVVSKVRAHICGVRSVVSTMYYRMSCSGLFWHDSDLKQAASSLEYTARIDNGFCTVAAAAITRTSHRHRAHIPISTPSHSQPSLANSNQTHTNAHTISIQHNVRLPPNQEALRRHGQHPQL